MLARTEEQLTALTVGILRYSRDLAFAAATAYADAAEARGSWDSRMEASVVDAVVRGDTGPELLSRAAALNWDTTAATTVVVGTPPIGREDSAGEAIRAIALRHDRAALADVHGTYSVYKGSRETAVRHSVQFPSNDPTLIIPAMAAATRYLGFASTYSTTYYPPYHTAKLFSTLDHLTEGRVGWNIVTSYLADANANR
jgi:alkanesulfonate monooxygenase SsuD/methylene tetrahydromethanopterin reductase-like flavin-dependent oxidoreductase (luciferase family)